ncbi:uncharacterized protein LOC135843893 [Planococcus citri]|uniref:uncharacterized protein LOC135843893 n=1 Tax=Planococcus citri TaxID=170843 RepID=UPI0031F7B304
MACEQSTNGDNSQPSEIGDFGKVLRSTLTNFAANERTVRAKNIIVVIVGSSDTTFTVLPIGHKSDNVDIIDKSEIYPYRPTDFSKQHVNVDPIRSFFERYPNATEEIRTQIVKHVLRPNQYPLPPQSGGVINEQLHGTSSRAQKHKSNDPRQLALLFEDGEDDGSIMGKRAKLSNAETIDRHLAEADEDFRSIETIERSRLLIRMHQEQISFERIVINQAAKGDYTFGQKHRAQFDAKLSTIWGGFDEYFNKLRKEAGQKKKKRSVPFEELDYKKKRIELQKSWAWAEQSTTAELIKPPIYASSFEGRDRRVRYLNGDYEGTMTVPFTFNNRTFPNVQIPERYSLIWSECKTSPKPRELLLVVSVKSAIDYVKAELAEKQTNKLDLDRACYLYALQSGFMAKAACRVPNCKSSFSAPKTRDGHEKKEKIVGKPHFTPLKWLRQMHKNHTKLLTDSELGQIETLFAKMTEMNKSIEDTDDDEIIDSDYSPTDPEDDQYDSVEESESEN